MMKSLQRLLKADKERYTVPRKVQDVIPIKRIWNDGIFLVGGKYAKTYKFSDINYLVASREDKESMFLSYSELLNSLDSGATTKLTINNHRVNKRDFEDAILMPMRGDGLDVYRKEYNQMLIDKATGGNGIMQEKYITISVQKKDIEEARAYFARTGADLIAHFAALGSKCVEMNAAERLRVLHDFYRSGEESSFHFDVRDMMQKGHDFKDYICPDAIEKNSDYLRLGDKFCRVIFLKDYASYIKDSMVSELTDLNRNMMLSIDVIPIPTDEAVREVENRLLGVETNITNWQRRQNSNNNFSAVIPYDMELQRKESKEFLDDLTTRDQRMMFAVITMVHMADTKEQLDADTEAILATARKHMCQMAPLKYQQLDGLNTVLPIGARKINTFRTLTTESLAVFIPFKVQEIMDKGGIYFGENAISHNLILCNKANLLNQSAFLLGVPGAGKSFSAKELITFLILNTDDDILINDPEGEYAPLVEAMGDMGSVIHVSAGGKDRLNAMYMVDGYGENNPIVVKSQFIMSLIEQIDNKAVGAQHKSIIDRCITLVYAEAAETGIVPTLTTLREKLMEQPEPEAKQIALSLELYTTGSLDIFG
jgi:type IV secretory pathway VirB4 component